MSNEPSDFIGTLQPVMVNLKSYDEEKKVKMMKGTLKWNWNDDEGKLHSLKLKNSYYDPKGTRLLSPQHWTKEIKDLYPKGTVYYQGDDDNITLHWGQYHSTHKNNMSKVADIKASS